MQQYTSSRSVWNQSSASTLSFVIILLVIHYGTKAIKTRVTYPRTGFVEYRTGPATLIATALSAALIVVAIGLGARWHWSLATAATVYGLILAAGYAYRIARATPWKWVVVAIMSAGSVAAAWLPDDGVQRHFPAGLGPAFLLTFSVSGVVLAVSGAITLRQYLRCTPLPEEELP
jgi:hypothetical protein